MSSSQPRTSSKRKSRQYSEQMKQPLSTLQRPNGDNREAWHAYWHTQNQDWRTEAEIDMERRTELTKCLTSLSNVEEDIYPFKGKKLSRADIEWLLATHEDGRGPVEWGDESQRERNGLDIRGADLCFVNLSNLPLARIRGGPTTIEETIRMEEHHSHSVVQLKEADLNGAHLERAILSGAQLERTDFIGAHLEGADLKGADLKGAYFTEAQLEGADLSGADLS